MVSRNSIYPFSRDGAFSAFSAYIKYTSIYIYILNIQNVYLQEQIINYREPLGILHKGKRCELPIVV